MSEELGTKDVLAQVNTCLGNVEQDIRELRTEMNARFDGLRSEMDVRFRAVDQRFMWLYGLLVALVIGVAGLWFK